MFCLIGAHAEFILPGIVYWKHCNHVIGNTAKVVRAGIVNLTSEDCYLEAIVQHDFEVVAVSFDLCIHWLQNFVRK